MPYLFPFLGRSKSNLGWTPLHLACYFGHKQVVEDLLKVLLWLKFLMTIINTIHMNSVKCKSKKRQLDHKDLFKTSFWGLVL